jgi:hypothetical protein
MSKHHDRDMEIASGTAAGAAAAKTVDAIKTRARPVERVWERAASGSAPDHEQIAQLAFLYWQARGCPHGSAEEDWLRAEAELGKQSTGTKA